MIDKFQNRKQLHKQSSATMRNYELRKT